jgi:plasmid stabilization system protein ParE
MRPVKWHPAAEAEFQEALDWYAERNPAASWAFFREVRDAITSLSHDPTRLPSLGAKRHFAILKRFPYLVIYRVTSDTIQVLAVAHASRRPAYWRGRDADSTT